MPCSHRLHYQWSQLEADRCGVSVGSPSHPLPKPDRTLQLHPECEYICRSASHCLAAYSPGPFEQERFAACSRRYKTIYYHTFEKCGGLKLTEAELFFLSSHMTSTSSSEWGVVYLGVGDGDRFRYLRDEFFPGLAVIAFDPAPDHSYETDPVSKQAQLWNDDGTNFTFYVRCFELDSDVALIRQRLVGRRILLISDIRGDAYHGQAFHGNTARRYDTKRHLLATKTEGDQDLQWRAIQGLCPVGSLVKFKVPSMEDRFYDYAPGVLLKQVFCSHGTYEVRLMIDGVPEKSKRYDGWELHEKMMFHHEHLRGQVYESPRRQDCTQCFDHCFDCTVLWDTVSAYAATNNIDPHKALRAVMKYHIYGPSWFCECMESPGVGVPSHSQRFWDVVFYLNRGFLMPAIAALELEDQDNEEDTDWVDVAQHIIGIQPELAQCIVLVKRPASRRSLIQLLGSLGEPLTLLRTEMNGLVED